MLKTPKFRAIQIRPACVKPAGTPRPISHWVAVEVNGVVHDVGINCSNSLAHLPEGLRDHPQSEEIKRVVNKAYYDALMAGVGELRPDLGQRIDKRKRD
jgi:hypothetical protein